MTSNQKKLAAYEASNLEAATIIAADPVKYREGSLMQQWADAITTKAAIADGDCAQLSEETAA